MPNIKLYGLPRSCTNYVAWLLDHNFSQTTAWHSRGGWKHAETPCEVMGMDGYALAWKGPYAWLASMLRYQPAPLSQLVGRWNRTARGHLDFAAALTERGIPWAIIQHEDIVRDVAAVVYVAGRVLGLEPTYRGTPRTQRRHAVTDEPFDAAYYTEARYLARFSPDDRRRIEEELDPAAVRGLGYTLLGW